MNDNTRALIEMVLKTAGQAGSQGFAYLVAYTRTDGAVGCLFSLVVLGIVATFMAWLLRWKPEKSGHYDDFISPNGWRGAGLAACALLTLICIGEFGDNLVEWLQPQGAAILSALHHSV